jgi:hypothetical protein
MEQVSVRSPLALPIADWSSIFLDSRQLERHSLGGLANMILWVLGFRCFSFAYWPKKLNECLFMSVTIFVQIFAEILTIPHCYLL